MQNLLQRKGPSRAARLSGALRGSRRAPWGLLPSGRAGALAGENLSRRALLREMCVADSDNSSSVPWRGSALPPHIPGPGASGAEGQQPLCPRPGRGTEALAHTKAGYCTTASSIPSGATASRRGKESGWLGAGSRAALPAHARLPQLLRWVPWAGGAALSPARSIVAAARSSNSPTNPGGATRVGFAPSPLASLRCICPNFGAASPSVCLHHEGGKPQRREVLCETGMETLPQGNLRP